MRGKVHRENMRKNGSTKLAREENDLHCGESGAARCHDRAGIAVSHSPSHCRAESAFSDSKAIRICVESGLNQGAKNRIEVEEWGALGAPLEERGGVGDLAGNVWIYGASQTV